MAKPASSSKRAARAAGSRRVVRSTPAKAGPTAVASSRIREEIRELEPLDRLAEVFASLGSAPRLRLLYLVYHRPDLTVGELSGLTGLTISGVSMHLRRLRQSNLVCCRREGQSVCCTLPARGEHVEFLSQLFGQIAAETGCCRF